MRQFGCLEAIVKSFYSRDLYRDVAENWKGGVLLYLLLLLMFCWAFLSIHIQKGVNTGYGVFSNQFFPQIPEMTIQAGELKTPENRPYLIMSNDKDVIAIIDTTGKYNNLENTSAEVLVTKNAIFYKNKKDVNKSHVFSSSVNLSIKPALLKNKMEIVVNWLWVLLFPFLLLFSFIYRLVQAALYAIIGELLAILWHIPLTYGQVFKLTLFAITPAIVIGSVLDWFYVSFPYSWLFYFILSMGYLIFGIRANRSNEGKKII